MNANRAACRARHTWKNLAVWARGQDTQPRHAARFSITLPQPDVFRIGIVEMRGSMVVSLRPCMTMNTPPPRQMAPPRGLRGGAGYAVQARRGVFNPTSLLPRRRGSLTTAFPALTPPLLNLGSTLNNNRFFHSKSTTSKRLQANSAARGFPNPTPIPIPTPIPTCLLPLALAFPT